MNHRKSASCWSLALAIFALNAILMPNAWSQTETVLHSFGAPGDGAQPLAGVILDTNGNLYGTTWVGGVANGSFNCNPGCGTVFQLTPSSDGTWNERIIYDFEGGYPGHGIDGGFPNGPVTLGHDGNLYGWIGCTVFGCGDFNGGLLFQLVQGANGTWTERIIYYLDNQETYGSCNGAACSVAFDHEGRMYGTTPEGGSYGGGVAHSFGSTRPFDFFDHAIHQFSGGNDDGSGAYTSLAFDDSGNIYGTTISGGTGDLGTVFRLTPTSGGGWMESLIYSFQGSHFDGAIPTSGVIFGPDGNLYGTTYAGGLSDAGTAFKLVPNPDGTWSESVIRSFGGDTGARPSPLTFDAAGNLYGTAQGGFGCLPSYCGLVFKLTPSPGQWILTVLYSFEGGSDGSIPDSGVVMDNAGNLYGTTNYGGPYGQGVVYEVTP